MHHLALGHLLGIPTTLVMQPSRTHRPSATGPNLAHSAAYDHTHKGIYTSRMCRPHSDPRAYRLASSSLVCQSTSRLFQLSLFQPPGPSGSSQRGLSSEFCIDSICHCAELAGQSTAVLSPGWTTPPRTMQRYTTRQQYGWLAGDSGSMTKSLGWRRLAAGYPGPSQPICRTDSICHGSSIMEKSARAAMGHQRLLNRLSSTRARRGAQMSHQQVRSIAP